jgi:hypothetical protein
MTGLRAASPFGWAGAEPGRLAKTTAMAEAGTTARSNMFMV